MLRNTTRRKRLCPEEAGAALPPGPTNGPARLAREVSAPAASLTRGNTPQADSSGSTSASPSPACAPVAHGRKERRGHAQRDERSACDAAQLTTRSDTTFRRARFRCAAVKTTAKRGTGHANGEGEVSLCARKGKARKRSEPADENAHANEGAPENGTMPANDAGAHQIPLANHTAENQTGLEKYIAPPREVAAPVAAYDEAMHSDVSALVDAIFRVANPMDVSVRLLKSADERIVEKHINQLYQMRYGKPGTAAPVDSDEPPMFILDMPRPNRSGTT